MVMLASTFTLPRIIKLLLAWTLTVTAGIAEPMSLFDGSLASWEGDTDNVWRVRDGVIVGGTLAGNPQNEFLATRQSFGNFRLRLEYKIVGTEGFVPPEGPGTAKADIYSLGMVLYELSTGKDRLDFPELPDNLALSSSQRRDWQALNQIICRCCTHDEKQRYSTASELAEKLASIASPTKRSWIGRTTALPFRLLAAGCGVVVLGVLSTVFFSSKDTPSHNTDLPLREASAAAPSTDTVPAEASSPVEAPEKTASSRMLSTTAAGAYFYTSQGQEIGALPISLEQIGQLPIEEGEILAPGYRERKIRMAQLVGNVPSDQPIVFPLSRAPEPLHGWTSPLGIVFRYDVSQTRHLSIWPVGASRFRQFQADMKEEVLAKEDFDFVEAGSLFPGADCEDKTLVATTEAIALRFCEWINASPEKKGALLPNQSYKPLLKPLFWPLQMVLTDVKIRGRRNRSQQQINGKRNQDEHHQPDQDS